MKTAIQTTVERRTRDRPSAASPGQRVVSSTETEETINDSHVQQTSSETESSGPEDWGYDLLLYGNELMLRGSDNGTLLAFAAIALQELKGRTEAHHNVASGLLVFAVLMCAVVHLAIGCAYVGRAKKLIRRQLESGQTGWQSRLFISIAWIAAILQFACTIAGAVLVLFKEPPLVLRPVIWIFTGEWVAE